MASPRRVGSDGASGQAKLTPSPALPLQGEEQARPRDYYRIEDEDGRRYWVFREGLYQESAGGALPAGICTGCSGDGSP